MSGRPGRSIPEEMTERRLQILRLLSEGHSNAKIGELLGITENTVKSHMKYLFGMLAVDDRAAVVSAAYEWGYLSTTHDQQLRNQIKSLKRKVTCLKQECRDLADTISVQATEIARLKRTNRRLGDLVPNFNHGEAE